MSCVDRQNLGQLIVFCDIVSFLTVLFRFQPTHNMFSLKSVQTMKMSKEVFRQPRISCAKTADCYEYFTHTFFNVSATRKGFII